MHSLTARQHNLRRALEERDSIARSTSRLAEIYVGACVVVQVAGNPDRYAQAAQSMRELLEKLPLSSSDIVLRRGRTASDRQKSIIDLFARAKASSSCFDSERNTWQGAVDEPLLALLAALEEASLERSTGEIKRQRSLSFIRSQDPTGEPLPGDVEEDLLRQWITLDKYFQSVAHHGDGSALGEFEQRLTECTELLLRLLGTTTLETLDVLDRLIAEAE